MSHFSQKVPSTTAPQTTSDRLLITQLLIAQTAIPFGMLVLYIILLNIPRFMGGANSHISTVGCVWASFLAMLVSVGLAIYNLIERKKQTCTKKKKIFMSAAIGTGSISFLLLVVSYWVLFKHLKNFKLTQPGKALFNIVREKVWRDDETGVSRLVDVAPSVRYNPKWGFGLAGGNGLKSVLLNRKEIRVNKLF